MRSPLGRLVGTVVPIAALAMAACGYPDPYASAAPIANESPAPQATVSPSAGADDFNAGAGLPVVTYPDGLKYIDLKVGTGDVASTGMNVTVQYTGWLSTGGKPQAAAYGSRCTSTMPEVVKPQMT